MVSVAVADRRQATRSVCGRRPDRAVALAARRRGPAFMSPIICRRLLVLVRGGPASVKRDGRCGG